MTERTLYKCDLCGTEYALIDNAYACEAFHRKPKQIEKLYYKPKNMGDVAEYPYEIVVLFSDGEKRVYRK